MPVEFIVLGLIFFLGFGLFYLLFIKQFDRLEKKQDNEIDNIANVLDEEFRKQRSEFTEQSNLLRNSLHESIKGTNEIINDSLQNIASMQQANLKSFAEQLTDLVSRLDKNAFDLRGEINEGLKNLSDTLSKGQSDNLQIQNEQFISFGNNLQNFSQNMMESSDKLREMVDKKLSEIQSDNNQKLEKMRATVEEKLQGTLEKRLTESFSLVSESLNNVQQGLGEMKTLATGVGDLKNVLSNVKTRGSWGEMQLGNLLEQIFTAEQYATNVKIKPHSDEEVDFAIKLPGKNKLLNEELWLPIDAKFPKEDYERLIEFSQNSDVAGVATATRALEAGIRREAKSISSKYLEPPFTTDFAIMYLPIEGLYAEALRIPGLVENIQNEHRVLIASPTTLAALLNALQVGFNTLSIERKSAEVWNLLGGIKNEFGKFGDLLEKVKKKIEETGNVIGDASVRSRAIERKLREVKTIGFQSDQNEEISTTDLLEERDNVSDETNDNSYNSNY